MSHLKLIASNNFDLPTHVTAKDVCLSAFGWSKPRNAICPVQPDVLVEVHTAGARRLVGKAGDFKWYPKGDITHYRRINENAIEHIDIVQIPHQENK